MPRDWKVKIKDSSLLIRLNVELELNVNGGATDLCAVWMTML